MGVRRMTEQQINLVKKYLDNRKENEKCIQMLEIINSETIEIVDPVTRRNKLVPNNDGYRINIIQKNIHPTILNKILYKELL